MVRVTQFSIGGSPIGMLRISLENPRLENPVCVVLWMAVLHFQLPAILARSVPKKLVR